jgi:penicillin-binding protein 1A
LRNLPKLAWPARYGITLVVAAALLASISTAGVLTLSTFPHAAHAGKPKRIELNPLAVRSFIYDQNGNEMAVLMAEEDREEIDLELMPKQVQDAVLTIEDRDFYTHKGLSIRAAVRALTSNIEAGTIRQGGSTITQQVIKNSIVGSQQTFARKAREAVLAMQLETQMSKKQILERYLNTVYLGNGAYGVQAFAETYYNTTAEKLDWPEAALLTALIRNPVGYDPIKHPELSMKRRALVAHELLTAGKIDAAQEQAINAAPLPQQAVRRATTRSSLNLAGANYFSEEVKQQMLVLPELGATPEARRDAVFKGGLRVTTTYDPEAQKMAEAAVKSLPDTNGEFTAALASVEPGTGKVRAVVGGANFDEQKFNYATQGFRQPGSSFKFFTLMAAFEEGKLPTDSISGISPCSFKDPGSPGGTYTAKNSGGGGKVGSILSQTTASSNCAFLRLAQAVGLDKVAAMANSMGVVTLNPPVDANGKLIKNPDGSSPPAVQGPVPSDIFSMPIGSKEVHPIAMAAAYAAAANDGVYVAPYFIEKVTDSKGTVIYQHKDAGKRVASTQAARYTTQVLEANVKSGTGRKAALKRQVAAGKTGTTQDNADVWFVGYTPYLSTAVWIGNPENRNRVRIGGRVQFGADYPAMIWNRFMAPMHDKLTPKDFSEPDKSTRRPTSISDKSSGSTTAGCKTFPCRPTRRPTTTVAGGSGTTDAPPPTNTPATPNRAGPPATAPPQGQ